MKTITWEELINPGISIQRSMIIKSRIHKKIIIPKATKKKLYTRRLISWKRAEKLFTAL